MEIAAGWWTDFSRSVYLLHVHVLALAVGQHMPGTGSQYLGAQSKSTASKRSAAGAKLGHRLPYSLVSICCI